MNQQAGLQYQKADKELNSVYQKILKEYSKQPTFVVKLKTAQRLWVQLRNAELEARFPEPAQYGSALPACRAIYLADLTRQRIQFLKTWLTGIPEGDVCNGSVKIKR
ncbi:lysozyme inhibitor LprI family protein [Mucilaginibacter sp. CSA2-8R]|uniref:lysozyme inhibitor LprI family protein n=1 Tax=Mucilaginibacter sp. CSA2-8R TaxID=3141542 RepID=UPI00315DC88C